MRAVQWLVLLCVALAAAVVHAQAVVKLQQVSPSAWYAQGEAAVGSTGNRNFISNAGMVITPEGVVVIDALGAPQLARELIAEIHRQTGKKVTHVIVTHYHADHIYGLQEFKREGATVVAHRAGLEYLNSELAQSRMAASRTELAPWIDAETRLVPADRWIDGPTELVVGGVKLLIQPVGPAHTPEDVAVFLASEKVLFAGDLVFRGRIPFVGQANSAQWIKSLNTILAFDARVVIPGHGPLSTQAREDMELTRDYLTYLRQTMGRAAKEMEPFDEAYQRTDWSRYEGVPLFRAANRMNAYNTYLLMEHEAD